MCFRTLFSYCIAFSMKNSGKQYERLFEGHLLQTRGKSYALHRFTDASDVRGRTGLVTTQPKQPADFVSVVDGLTAYTEVKSTLSDVSFPFGLLNENQHAQADRITRAGGEYVVFVYAVTKAQWFRVPYSAISEVRSAGRQSIKWVELQPWT